MNPPGRRKAPRVPPRDDTLDGAVARMTAWADEQGHSGLIMSSDEWQSLVLRYLLKRCSAGRYIQELYRRASEVATLKEAQQLTDLAINIWNNTPQPDRGGKSAFEIAKMSKGPRTGGTMT